MSSSLSLEPGQPSEEAISHHKGRPWPPRLPQTHDLPYSTHISRPTRNLPWAQRLLRTHSPSQWCCPAWTMINGRHTSCRIGDMAPLGAAWVYPHQTASSASVQAGGSDLQPGSGPLLPQPLLRVCSFSSHHRVCFRFSMWVFVASGFLVLLIVQTCLG